MAALCHALPLSASVLCRCTLGTMGWFLCSHKDTFVPKSQSGKIKGKAQALSRPIPHLSLNNPESQAKKKDWSQDQIFILELRFQFWL